MAKVNVLEEILGWSADRPSWQRDALRRLAVHGELQEADIAALVELCKAQHGLAEKAAPEPLAAKHFPDSGAVSKAVSLVSLTHHDGVNALAQAQVVGFGPALTAVYGANAAGKSGYTRILKRACRARGAEEILGNVVSGAVPGRPSATIKYAVDGKDGEFQWDDDKPANPFLSRVSVFDRHCASVYIAEQTDVAFRPLGLDLFDKLSNACEAVRTALDKERRELEAAARKLPEVPAGTKVHDLISHLTSLTNAEQVKRLAMLSNQEKARLDDLRKSLRDLQSDDPQRAARALDLRARRVDALTAKVSAVAETLSDQAILDVFSARDRMIRSRQAAEAMRRAAFEKQPLPNTGSDAWRAMWNAAERFSTVDAYPDLTFPVTGQDFRCVLCQQELRKEGTERLLRFHEFLGSAIQRERDEATIHYERLQKRLAEIVTGGEATAETLEELQLEDSSVGGAVKAFLESAEARRVAATKALGEESPCPARLPQSGLDPQILVMHSKSLTDRANQLRQASHPRAIAEIQSELGELESRKVLSDHLESVLGEIERKKRLAAYQLCLDETKTTAITRKSSEVTKLAVTDQLAKSFKEELDALKFRHVEVEMSAAGGSRGSLYHKLQLRRAPGVSVPKVVSEGEARCLSIASFFAELSTAADQSAILFDDPVSSLDHNWRDNVAARLVLESKSRQVIVFTHDIVFLVSLVEHAGKSGIDIKHQNLRRAYTAAGLSEQGPPYQGMKVSARISYLKDRLQAAGTLYRENKPAEYEDVGKHIYGHLRQAWERAVEEVLLNGIVERYRKSVETQRAKCLGDISQDDCRALDDGMSKCSKWEGGHDHAAAEGTQFPDPKELAQDITALEEWVSEIRKRRRG